MQGRIEEEMALGSRHSQHFRHLPGLIPARPVIDALLGTALAAP